LRLVGLIAGNDEKRLHEQFADDRVHGEWFNPSPLLLAYIRQQAASELQLHAASSQQLRITKNPVSVASATRADFEEAFFDHVLKNDETLHGQLIYGFEWGDNGWAPPDDGEEYDEDDWYIDCELQAVEEFWHAVTGEKFVDSIGINFDAGLIGFICGPCNSQKRMGILEHLASIAWDLDCVGGGWFCFAMFHDGPKHIGIDLVQLHIAAFSRNTHAPPVELNYIFDPKDMRFDDYKGQEETE
jgi:hypothetical protein